ncbi:hypothetical protein I0C86_42000 [Plantactinospora sp. S1510]|uniref:Transposase n=1 Tax=Plantactinospora alkalitolerans TaxID=2789879 RepID=A0ABS0HB75_9ACTN|nr:hypothetical protein [Plantactinospora alkalitolerans]MBF9135428.1 hypothetical protein [Plantactinospora alkalitolerans]
MLLKQVWRGIRNMAVEYRRASAHRSRVDDYWRDGTRWRPGYGPHQ